jgi:hypothetical protein
LPLGWLALLSRSPPRAAVTGFGLAVMLALALLTPARTQSWMIGCPQRKQTYVTSFDALMRSYSDTIGASFCRLYSYQW